MAQAFRTDQYNAEDAALLERIVRRCGDAGPGHVAVFDLDGCLFDTRPRQVRILRELAGRHGLPELYKVREEHFWDWTLEHTLRRAGLPPGWIETNLKRVQAGWQARFFTSSAVSLDHALPGAPELVRAVHDTGVDVIYLTARDETTRGGTEACLRHFEFPLDGPRAGLLLKPRFEDDDTAFKEGAIEHIARVGEVIVYLDNEPANVNVFKRHHPDALVVFVDTDHSPRPDRPHPSLPWLRTFLRRPLD